MDYNNRVHDTLHNLCRRLNFCRYIRMKSLTQGLLDVSMVVVNAAHLTKVLRLGPALHPFYYAVVSMIAVSITLEVSVSSFSQL